MLLAARVIQAQNIKVERKHVDPKATTTTNDVLFMLCSINEMNSGDVGRYLPNYQTNLFIALHAISQLFCNFTDTPAYHLGRYEPNSLLLPKSSMDEQIVFSQIRID